MTLEKIRAALPTHIMLTPENIVKKGDLELVFTLDGPDHGEWREINPANRIGTHWQTGKPYKVKDFYAHFARPVPPRILDNQAFYLWAGQYGGVVPTWENDADVRKHIEKGRLYDKWLLEQMEDV